MQLLKDKSFISFMFIKVESYVPNFGPTLREFRDLKTCD